MASTGGRRPAGRLGVLGERNFRLFFTGYITSLTGSAMVPVALVFAVLDQGWGTAAVGYVLGAETVPLVALLLLGGVAADRVPRRASMIAADLARFASEGVLAVLLLTGSAPLWIVMALAAVLGIGQAFFNPAMTGLMPEMVSAERLQSANALRGVASSAGQVLGPALAGIIVATAGAGWAIAIDSATYAASAACLLRLNIPAHPPSRQSPVLAQLAGGWREFRSRTSGTLTFAADGQDTLMSWDWQVRPKGWLRLLGPLTGPLGGRMEHKIWTGLKHQLEGEANASPA